MTANWETQFTWSKTEKRYRGEVEWKGDRIELSIYTNGKEDVKIIESARAIVGCIKERETEFKEYAARDLLSIFNENFPEKPFDTEAFINNIDLGAVKIFSDGEGVLEYITWGGPLVVITISPDMSYKEALLE